MPAATTKDDLIAKCIAEYHKLDAVLSTLEPPQALSPREDGVSIKDVVAHRAHWIDLWLGWDTDGRAGRPVFMPAKGYKWSQLSEYNAALRTAQADLGWPDAKVRLADRHAALMARLTSLSDDELYGGPMVGGNGKWTAGRYAESAGASHYRSAAKVIRRWLRCG